MKLDSGVSYFFWECLLKVSRMLRFDSWSTCSMTKINQVFILIKSSCLCCPGERGWFKWQTGVHYWEPEGRQVLHVPCTRREPVWSGSSMWDKRLHNTQGNTGSVHILFPYTVSYNAFYQFHLAKGTFFCLKRAVGQRPNKCIWVHAVHVLNVYSTHLKSIVANASNNTLWKI